MMKYLNKTTSAWNSLSSPVKASAVFLTATIFLKGIVFLTTPIFTRIMSETDIGIVGTYQSWKGIFEAIAILSMTSAGVFNVGMSRYRDSRDKYMSNMVGLCAILGVFWGIVLFFFYNKLYFMLQVPKSLVVLIALYSIITPAQTFWIAKQRYEYKYKAVFFVTVIMALLGQVMSIVCVYISNNNLSEVRLWATAVVELPFGIFFMILALKRGKQIINKSIWFDTLVFAIPLIPHYLSSVVLTASDRIMISVLDSPAEAGIYTVVYGVASIVTIIWGAIQGSLTPYIYDKLDNNNCDGITIVAEKLILGYGTICLLVAFFAPEVMMVLGPKSYQTGIYVMPSITGAIFISCLYNLFSVIEFYHRKSVFITIASVAAAISNILLNIIFIPIYGFVAAGFTTLAAYMVLALMHYVNMTRIEKRPIYNNKRIFTLSTIMLIAILASTTLYNTYVIRYIIGIIIVAMIFVKRNEFIKALKHK